MTQCCVISDLWMFPKLVAKMSTHLLIPDYFAHVFPKGGLPRKLRSFVWESVPPHCRRAHWKGLSYIFFPSDCMTQSISGKGLKPDIPHFTHGLNHVEHCVPRPIWIRLRFPGKERSLMWLDLTFYIASTNPIGQTRQIGPHGLSSW